MPVVLSKRVGDVQVLTLNRPEKRNAINAELSAAFLSQLEEADRDPDIRVIVVTGAGSAFCAGMDLAAFADRGGRPSRGGSIHRRSTTTPIIAAVNGPAVGGGLELVLRCDLAVAAEGARFGVTEVRRGIFAAGGATWRLARVAGERAALELLLTGELVSAQRALELGLVNRIVPAEHLLDETLGLATTVARGAPFGIAQTLRMVRSAFELSEDQLWELNAQCLAEVAGTENALEGARAFLEKREPEWRGR